MKNVEKREIIIGFDPASPNRDHELKITPDYFNRVKNGRKKSEFRRKDRDFQVGDLLTLREFRVDLHPSGYTGKSAICRITDIVHVNEIYSELRGAPDFVMLSFEIIHING